MAWGRISTLTQDSTSDLALRQKSFATCKNGDAALRKLALFRSRSKTSRSYTKLERPDSGPVEPKPSP